MTEASTHYLEPLQHARVLLELGELGDAEEQVAAALEGKPDDLDALGLFAKIKHMRGELSEAVACWAQILSRAPLEESARLHLVSMLQLAQDPERRAGEFVALGQFHLVRKPTAYLALEQAFRLYVARMPKEARGHCRLIAQKYRGRDRDVHKLAVLAEAWISELSGAIDDACEVLERFGRERGFETDLDRVLALARLYEQMDAPEKLQAAVNIFRFLVRSADRSTLLGRLARLHRRLGQESLAFEHAGLQLLAFRRELYRPSRGDVIAVAARRFVRLERLTRLRFPEGDRPTSPIGRERALAHALDGDLDRAEAGFARDGELLDRKYLAEVAALRGDHERATQLYLDVLREDPEDAALVAWAVDACETSPAQDLRAALLAGAVADRARRALELARDLEPRDPLRWSRLARLHELVAPSREAAGLRARATALEEGARMRERAIGRVLAGAVYHFFGRPQGLLHEIWAGREPASAGQGGMLAPERILGNLTHEMRHSVLSTFMATREFARAKFPHLTRDLLDFAYSFKVTKDDEPSGGISAGLPTALAFLSVFLQKPVVQDVCFTGVIVTDAHDVLTVRGVGELEHKVVAAVHRNMRGIVVPAANRAELERSVIVPAAVCADIVSYVSDLDAAATIAFDGEIE
jgi:hypothetical protein